MITIKTMQATDIAPLLRTFAAWDKSEFLFRLFYRDQQMGKRIVLIAWQGGDAIGYVNLVWQPIYKHFKAAGIPEIVDLNVITEYQNQGIGRQLIAECERLAREKGKMTIGISVEQSPPYAAANHLYPKLGYEPDGHGITPHDNELHLVKRLAVSD